MYTKDGRFGCFLNGPLFGRAYHRRWWLWQKPECKLSVTDDDTQTHQHQLRENSQVCVVWSAVVLIQCIAQTSWVCHVLTPTSTRLLNFGCVCKEHFSSSNFPLKSGQLITPFRSLLIACRAVSIYMLMNLYTYYAAGCSVCVYRPILSHWHHVSMDVIENEK